MRLSVVRVYDRGRKLSELELRHADGATELNDQQVRLVRDGMELLVGYLASVREG